MEVKLDDTYSRRRNMSGEVLGVFLFNINLTPITSAKYESIDVIAMYVDDTYLISTVGDDGGLGKLEQDIELFERLCTERGFVVNQKKTIAMCKEDFVLKIGDNMLKTTKKMKILGLSLQADLKLNDQIVLTMRNAMAKTWYLYWWLNAVG
jgi:hypothetical protein